jgi:hypothetical protein
MLGPLTPPAGEPPNTVVVEVTGITGGTGADEVPGSVAVELSEPAAPVPTGAGFDADGLAVTAEPPPTCAALPVFHAC